MSRREVFDAIKAARGGKGFAADEVPLIDVLLDRLQVPRDGTNEGSRDAITRATALIKQFEGCKLTAYPDPGSGGEPWTIGHGATGPGIHKGVTWTQAQADARLTEDVAKFARGVNDLIGAARTTDGQRAAMISLAYNIGLGAFANSTLLKLHRAGDTVGASKQFARWDKAAGKVMAGLARRREAEALEYRS